MFLFIQKCCCLLLTLSFICQGSKRNVECGGYKKSFKWRLFEESSIAKPKRQKTFSTITTLSSIPMSTTESEIKDIEASNGTVSPDFTAFDDIQEGFRTDVSRSIVRQVDRDSSHSPDSSGDVAFGFIPTEFTVDLFDSTADATTSQISKSSTFPPNAHWDNSSLSILEPLTTSSVIAIPLLPSLDPHTRTSVFWHTNTCSVMSINDTQENPWRLLWPMSQHHAALYHGLSAMATFHAAKEHPQFRIEAVDHMRNAIRELVIGLNNNMPTDVALATTVTLAFAEAWDQHISTGIAHLKGAKILIRQYVNSRKLFENSNVPIAKAEQDRLLRFRNLYNMWLYAAVLAKLTSDDEKETGGSVDSQDEQDLFFRDDAVDPLMGCAQTLFPLIGKVASLVRQVRLSGRDDIYVTGAVDLKKQLEEWEPSPNAQFMVTEDPYFDSSSCIATAYAYKYATLLYLYQCVPSLAGHSLPGDAPIFAHGSGELAVRVARESSVQFLAAKVVEVLSSVPYDSRTCVVHIYPLLACACEIDSEVLRAIVKERWFEMARRLQMGNVDRAFDVVEEVWRRKRVMKGQWCWSVGFTHWTTVMREWEWEVLLG
ncbi:fungal-specific transcription factor domain-containing protein [Lipomyces japonicus]|uniref:fungal-specific transcription factor domain-containing protein n=1 Tax=Lipomyces japonicus TaxID=56871 RepID=UPI0034CE6C35